MEGIEIERIEGESPALVFLHEGLGCVSRWRDFPRKVAEATGRRAIVYSRRGYGRSAPEPLPRLLSFMHEEALDELPLLLAEEKIDDMILVGHSDGASIAFIYAGAKRCAGVRGIVAIAPHTFVEDECVDAIERLRAQFLDPATEVRDKLAKHHADVDNAFLGWAGAWLDPDFVEWDITEYLPDVTVPVMVIQGEDDEYGTLDQVEAIRDEAGGPVERVILADCGHVPQRDRPDATFDAVVRFVRDRL